MTTVRPLPIEHPVLNNLAGSPRWWTIPGSTPDDPKSELVLVDYRWKHPSLWFFVVLPQGVYANPPFVAPTFKMGKIATERLREIGGFIIPCDSPHGRQLLETLK